MPEPTGSITAQLIVGVTLLATYILIALEAAHRTLVAFVAGALLLMVSHIGGHFSAELRILQFDDAMASIDWNVIFLLLGMMIIVGILKDTGVFQWCAYRAFALSRGRSFVMAAAMMLLTAILSAFLDNVTTMLLVAPVTITVSRLLNLSPLALLIPETLASNIGGTATLIGDPPNIMIGSHAGLTFLDFLEHLLPVCTIILLVHLLHMGWIYRRDFAVRMNSVEVSETLDRLRAECRITDRALLVYGGSVLGIVILMFLLHGVFEMPVAVPALAGAGALLVVRDVIELRRSRGRETAVTEKAHGILLALEREVEWPTLIFFIFLFVIAAAADRVGLIALLAKRVEVVSGGSLVTAMLITLWVSAIASAFIDNIPFTATMLPILSRLMGTFGDDGQILWWALSLGACLGGNGTIIGASANVVAAGLAEKAGVPLSFVGFMRVGFPAMVLQVLLAMLWLLIVEPLLHG